MQRILPGCSLVRLMALVFFFSSSTIFAGCSSAEPRFRSGEEVTAEDDDEREGADVAADVESEDDRKVDLAKVNFHKAGPPEDDAPAGMSRDRTLMEVFGLLGTPYKYGGTTRSGMDCSAFTARVYQNAANTPLPRSARGQYHVGAKVRKDGLRFGDLVFFVTRGKRVSHVGIYLEDGMFAHASVVEGITVSSLESTYYRKRYVGARRILD